MKTIHILIFLLVGIALSCATERVKLLSEAEEVLPGHWEIISVKLPKKNGSGITYQGNTFKADTILYEVGSIEIDDFSTDTLSDLNSNSHHRGKVKCNLRIGNENFPVAIHYLFISGEDIFSNFNYNGPPGVDTIDTHGEQFFYSSHIFSRN